jgi:quercetin dioxygenase-like cupin family protein
MISARDQAILRGTVTMTAPLIGGEAIRNGKPSYIQQELQPLFRTSAGHFFRFVNLGGWKENFMTTNRIMTAAALIAAGMLAPHVALAQQPGVKRTDLQRHDLGVPGREVIQVHVELAPGVAFPKHSHPGEEIIYVLTGSLEYEVEGKPPVILEAGDVLFIPAGTVHSAKNVGSNSGAELATYIVEKGKPLVVLSK